MGQAFLSALFRFSLPQTRFLLFSSLLFCSCPFAFCNSAVPPLQGSWVFCSIRYRCLTAPARAVAALRAALMAVFSRPKVRVEFVTTPPPM